jgi:hypothetical protein
VPASQTAVSKKPGIVITSSGDEQVQVHVANHLQPWQVWRGIGLVLGGIALFLLALCVTKYTFIGFRRYLQWNLSLLHSPAPAV